MEKFWIKWLEDGENEKIVASLREINSHGMEPGYYFIKRIGDLYDQEKCSHENLDKAKKLYYLCFKIIPSDY